MSEEPESQAVGEMPTIYQIEVGEGDVIVRTMTSNVLAAGYIEVDQATHDAARDAIMGGYGAWYRDGEVVPMPAPPAPPPPPIVLRGDVFFERTTEDEAEEIDAAMTAKPVKIRRAWQAANEFREGTDLWTALRDVIVDLYGEARAGELLAQPSLGTLMSEDVALVE